MKKNQLVTISLTSLHQILEIKLCGGLAARNLGREPLGLQDGPYMILVISTLGGFKLSSFAKL